MTTLLEGRASGADCARCELYLALGAGSQGASAADAGDDDRRGPAFALGRDRHHRDAAGRRADRPPQGRALAALRREPISRNTVIDPTIVRVPRVQIADDVIDASTRRGSPTSKGERQKEYYLLCPSQNDTGGDFGAEAPWNRRKNNGRLTISPDEIRDALKDFVKSYAPGKAAATEVGTSSTPPTASRTLRASRRHGERAHPFPDGTLGLAQNLDEDEIGVVVLGEFTGIVEGMEVTRTGEVLSVPVGDAYLGRASTRSAPRSTASARSRAEGRRALELQAPGVMQRKSVHEPMQTGIKAIDAMTPLAVASVKLIIGDRQTGKTAIAIDTIINQKANWESGDVNKQVRCIYVAIGQKGSTIAAGQGRPRRGRCHGIHDDRRCSGI